MKKQKNLLFLSVLTYIGCVQEKGSVSLCEVDCSIQEDTAESIDDTSLAEPTEEPSEEIEPSEPASSPSNTDDDGDGYSEDDGDCDDGNADASPLGNDESVDGVDQDCDGIDGVDNDGDGIASIESGGDDCDDTRPDISPTLPEACDDLDNDCDGVINNDRDCLVYAHSSNKLYEVEPFTMTITEITNVPNLYDFDTDLSGNLYGISPPSSVYTFDDNTVQWTQIATLNHNHGTLNGFCIDSLNNIYATVGNSVFTIDTTSGAVHLLGHLGGGFHSSGDCVVDKVDGIYMTSTGMGGDDLVRIDPTTGAGTLIGNTGVYGIYGLTSAWGYMFGFTGNGSLIQIDKTTGNATIRHTFPNIVFYGAASSSIR